VAVDPGLDFLEHQLWDHLGVKVIETPMAEFLNELERELGRIAPVDLER
jgi:hypothetical protein